MTDFLARVVAERRAAVARARVERPTIELDLNPRSRRGPVLRDALARRRAEGRLAVIAEVKRRSPALGELAPTLDLARQARAYALAGAAAISVLTEPRHWGGSLEDLRRVRAEVGDLPILAKDVVVDPYQIDEAAVWGADAVLLIAEALDDRTLSALIVHARSRGVEVLVEAHEPAAFSRAVASGAAIVGVNARDLRDPAVIDRSRARLLHGFVRDHQILVAESGIASADDVAELPARVDAVLVGTALMRAHDPGALVRSLAAVRVAPLVRGAVITQRMSERR